MRLRVDEFLRYKDTAGHSRRLQHGQIVRLEISRELSEAPDTTNVSLRWEFRIRDRWSWTGIGQSAPTFALMLPNKDEFRVLPIGVVSGLRLGVDSEFPRYIDFLAFGAPSFLVSSDDKSDAVSVALGLQVGLGGFFAVGWGVDWKFGERADGFFSIQLVMD